MRKNLVSEDQVKKALQINNFREMSKEKIMEFASLIPQIDKEVAIAIINQFPAFVDSAKTIVTQLNGLCDNIIKDNNSSKKDTINSYKMILSDLGELLKKDNISEEEREKIIDKMILVADKISEKDIENTEFLKDIIRYIVPVFGSALILGAAILGVNVKGTKIPSIKNV